MFESDPVSVEIGNFVNIGDDEDMPFVGGNLTSQRVCTKPEGIQSATARDPQLSALKPIKMEPNYVEAWSSGGKSAVEANHSRKQKFSASLKSKSSQFFSKSTGKSQESSSVTCTSAISCEPLGEFQFKMESVDEDSIDRKSVQIDFDHSYAAPYSKYRWNDKWKNDPNGNSFDPGDTEWKSKLPPPPPNYDPFKSHPVQNFYAFFTPEMFELMATEINRSLKEKRKTDKDQSGEDSRGNNSRTYAVKFQFPTTAAEMEIFFGVLLHMSVVPMQYLPMYWSANTRYPPVGDAMPRHRFDFIRSNFQMVNSPSMVKGDLVQVQPLLDQIQAVCNSLPPSETHLIRDQEIYSYEANTEVFSVAVQSDKKFLRVLSDCDPTGMVQNFLIYKCDGQRHSDYICKLLERLEDGKNYKIVFEGDPINSSFASVDLIRSLQSRGFHTIAQVHSDQIGRAADILLPENQLLRQGKGALYAAVSDNQQLIVVQWVNNEAAVVNFISTFAGVEPKTFGSEKDSEPLGVPYVVHKYNEAKCHTALLQNPFEHRSMRWYMKIVHYLLDMTVRNCWLLEERWKQQISAQNSKLPEVSLPDYIYAVAEALVRYKRIPPALVDYKGGKMATSSQDEEIEFDLKDPVRVPKERKPRNTLRAEPAYRLDQIGHLPVFKDKLAGVKPTQHKCQRCKVNKADVKCVKCDVWLCTVETHNCFFLYHTEETVKYGKRKKRGTSAD